MDRMGKRIKLESKGKGKRREKDTIFKKKFSRNAPSGVIAKGSRIAIPKMQKLTQLTAVQTFLK